MSKKETVFVFDMDGVIVNTVDALFEVYMSFLAFFGFDGSRQEFERLNGPKLEEIVSFLKNKYNLEEEKSTLLKKYKEMVGEVYNDVKLILGVEKILKFLKHRNFKIALASSSHRKNIEFILKKFNIQDYFDFIVSGDEVSEAKPSPEIYLKIKEKFSSKDFYVIEDSLKGVSAAKSAGMKVILFDAFSSDNAIADYSILKMEELVNLMEKAGLLCKLVTISNEIDIRIDENFLINSSCKSKVDEIWSAEKRNNPSLFNGDIVAYQNHYKNGNKLMIRGFLTEYKYFFSRIKDPNLKIPVYPLSVSGIIKDPEGNVLFAKRKNVTEYQDYYELVPSGGISLDNCVDDKVLFSNQLIQEFEEETLFKKELITAVEPLCFIFDINDEVYDVCGIIHVNKPLAGIKHNLNEYSEYLVVNINDAKDFMKDKKIVPTSRILVDLFKKKVF